MLIIKYDTSKFIRKYTCENADTRYFRWSKKQDRQMRDMEPSKISPLALHGTAGAAAILLRQYFFALRILEERPYAVNSLESVQNLLSGMASSRKCPLVRARVLPGRLDGVFFCRALGEQGNS
jgi:hypothetical protein